MLPQPAQVLIRRFARRKMSNFMRFDICVHAALREARLRGTRRLATLLGCKCVMFQGRMAVDWDQPLRTVALC